MAIDQTDIAVVICQRIVHASYNLLMALEELKEVKDQLAGNGIDLATFAAAINSTPGLKHLDISTAKNLAASFPTSIEAALKALYDGSPTQQCWQALEAARN